MEIRKLSPNKYIVDGDSGEQYKVSLSGEGKSSIQCTCKGFVFRRTCKHIDGVREVLKKSGKRVSIKRQQEHFDFIRHYKECINKITREVLYEEESVPRVQR